jgi:hypothetical protein
LVFKVEMVETVEVRDLMAGDQLLGAEGMMTPENATAHNIGIPRAFIGATKVIRMSQTLRKSLRREQGKSEKNLLIVGRIQRVRQVPLAKRYHP